MRVVRQEMGMGMVLAVIVYQLGWFDAAMVLGEEGRVLGDSFCCMCWCGLYLVVCKIGTAPLDGRDLFYQHPNQFDLK